MNFVLLLTLFSHCFILSSQVETSADINGEARTLSRSKRIFASVELEKTSEVEEKVQIYKKRIKELENELATDEENEMKVQEKYRKKIELARNKFLVELQEMIPPHNRLVEEQKINKEKVAAQLASSSKRFHLLDSLIFIYKKAAQNMDHHGVVYIHNNQMDLGDPLYANAIIYFILNGAEFCNGIRIGKRVPLADDDLSKSKYNFFEALFEKLSKVSDPKKVVSKIEIEFMNDGLRAKMWAYWKNCIDLERTNKRKFEVILGSAGVLSKERQSNGSSEVRGVRLISDETKTHHFRGTEHHNVYKLCKLKSDTSFDIKLDFEESGEHPQLSSMVISRKTGSIKNDQNPNGKRLTNDVKISEDVEIEIEESMRKKKKFE